MLSKITPCLWFDSEAEEAANFYVGIFRDSKIVRVVRHGETGQEVHGRAPGSVCTVEFTLEGQRFVALNGGPVFKLSEAISFQIECENQAELDYYWDKLTSGGDARAQQCGWLKDRFGLSWQVVPKIVPQLLSDPDPAKADRVFGAIMQMQKLDFAALERAAAGE